MLSTVLKATPIVGQGYGLIKTAVRVYKTTSPTELYVELGKSVIEKCLPPNVKLLYYMMT